MTFKLVVKKLELSSRKFISREEIRSYCKILKLDYYEVIRYLITNDYIIRILRGIFYVKSLEERKSKKTSISFEDAVAESLSMKGIKNWYFGLESALKLNNVTHEFLAVETIINDAISRPNPFSIMGIKVRFAKISKKLFKFGIIENKIRYSDSEKTLLDMIYLGRYNNYSDEELKNKILDLGGSCKKAKLIKYAENYPKTVRNFLSEII